MSTVTVNYYGFDGTGKTVTEAKRDAGHKIEKLTSGYWTPEIISHRGQAMLIYRDLNGWSYRGITEESGAVRDGAVHGSGNYETKDECLVRARYHLAQNTWQQSDGLAVPDFVTDRNSKSELRSVFGFYLAYKTARTNGMNDHEAHEWACNHKVVA